MKKLDTNDFSNTKPIIVNNRINNTEQNTLCFLLL